MSHKEHHHDIFESRKQFQLERIILFSDAVFAIAITLLIIEIKIPKFSDVATEKDLVHQLGEKSSEFIGFLISFLVIGQFWTNHHKLFQYITGYTPGLIWLNLQMLLFVVLMPFSSNLNMQYGNFDFTWFWYSMNLALIGFSLFLMWRYISKHKDITSLADDKLFMKHSCTRALTVTGIFIIGGLLAFVPLNPVKIFSRFTFLLIFPALRYLNKRYNKKITIKKKPAL